MQYDTPTLTHSTTNGKSVGAVTTLDGSVFIVRHDSKQVEIYDAAQLELNRTIDVLGLGAQVYGLVAHDNFLYISDWDNQYVHRVNLEDETCTKWSVGNQPAGLSLTSTHNILVTCHGAGKVQEYSPDGVLIKEISLDDQVRLAWHAVPLSNGQLAVSYEGPQHQISIIDNNGHVVKSYGAPDEMQYPRGLVVDKHNCILVADQCNNRILAINPALTSAEQLSITIDGGLQWPYDMYLDETLSRLYVVEWNGGRLLALDNVKQVEVTSTPAA